jgi:hypothetical protein
MYKEDRGIIGKEYRYDELVDLIESIGYKQRVENYYVIVEDDGYINISYGQNVNFKHRINFCKNFYFSNSGKYKEINKFFEDFESFSKFIAEYHSDLFRKHKIKKIISNI